MKGDTYMPGPPKTDLVQPTPEARFWAWFADNSERLMDFEQDQDRVFDELSVALAQVHEGLTFEFGPREANHREFVVSADGQRQRFPAVTQLVAAAPAFSNWTIMAFRQPKGTRFTIEYDGNELAPDAIWFHAEPDGERIGLTLYVRGFSAHTQEFVQNASFILLDAALGEYTMETRIGFVQWQRLPAYPAEQGLHSFHNLPGLISGWANTA